MPLPFEGTQEKLYPVEKPFWLLERHGLSPNEYRDDSLMFDTPSDCLLDDDPENPRPEHLDERDSLEGLDERDYDHWTHQRKLGLAAPRKKKVQTND
jgi:hypothetical protein